MNTERINARFAKSHGDVVRTWNESHRDTKTGDVFTVTMAEHADGFKRVFSVVQ